MHKNLPFLLLVGLVLAVTVWFGARATSALLAYSRLNKEAIATIDSLRVQEGRGDHYQIFATYSFETPQGIYTSEGPVGPVYKNPWSAEKGMEKLQGKSLRIWYNSKKPSLNATTKIFPMKATLSTAILLGLLVYFIGLGIFVGGKQNAKRS